MAQIRSNHEWTQKKYSQPARRKCAFEKFYGKIPNYEKYLKNLGEMGVVCNIVKVKDNLKDQGMMQIFQCHAKTHKGSAHCILNLRKKVSY